MSECYVKNCDKMAAGFIKVGPIAIPVCSDHLLRTFTLATEAESKTNAIFGKLYQDVRDLK